MRDARLWIPLVVLLGFELIMQTGVYRHMLRPDTFAYNVNRVRRIIKSSPIQANTLVLGTSVPYQGILLPQLNASLADTGMVVQSAATEGAKIETQYLIYRDLAATNKQIKTIIFVADMSLAWKHRFGLDTSNRDMVAQFSRLEIFNTLDILQYRLRPQDYTYFLFRSLTYKKDLRDFVLDPPYRFKKINRELREQSPLYPHTNTNIYSMGGLGVVDLPTCIVRASRKELHMDAKEKVHDETGKEVSNLHHQRGVVRTCQQAGFEIYLKSLGITEWRDLYFERLRTVFAQIQKDGKKIIVVYPPYSNLVDPVNADPRAAIWQKHIHSICKPGLCKQIDTRHDLDGPRNLFYYYDILHLNQTGAEFWTGKLSLHLHEISNWAMQD